MSTTQVRVTGREPVTDTGFVMLGLGVLIVLSVIAFVGTLGFAGLWHGGWNDWNF